MPVLAAPAPIPPSMPPSLPRREWTRSEFYQLGDLGFFQGQRAELLEGEIVVQSPQNWPHASTADRIFELIKGAFGSGFWARMQLPLSLGLKSDPEPDISVVVGRREDYSNHPTTAALVVEVSDTTLSTDKSVKAGIYAAARIADYWIVDIAHRQLIVMRNPKPDPMHLFGSNYADVLIRDASSTVSPLAFPQVSIRVADLIV